MRLLRWTWVLVPVVAFFVYLFSFVDRPALLTDIDLLADTDAADHAYLLQHLDLARRYGDEWNFQNRTPWDRIQKHKLHHLLYHIVGHTVYLGFRTVLGLVGIASVYALFAVPALFGALNLCLLYYILSRIRPDDRIKPLYLAFAGFALSPWIFSSVTCSWVFSATLMLSCIALMMKWRTSWFGASLFIGLAMLSNMSLLSLHVFPTHKNYLARRGWWGFLRTSGLGVLVSLGVYFGSLVALSQFDRSFAPSNMMAYGSFFRHRVQGSTPLLSFHNFKSIATNQLVNAVVSNQPDPKVPETALALTFQHSRFGTAVTLLYLLVLAWAAARFVLTWWGGREGPRAEWLPRFLQDETAPVVVYAGALLVINLLVCAYCGFVYSPLMVPLIAICLYRYVETGPAWGRYLAYAATVLIIINNIMQIQQFRTALAVVTPGS